VGAALRRHGWSYLFVLPTFALFVVFTLVPVLQAFALSLQSARIASSEWVGLQNFVTLAEDPVFRQALGNTVLYSLVVVAAQLTLALVVASLIQPLGQKSQTFYRALFYLPLVNSAILVAMAWSFLCGLLGVILILAWTATRHVFWAWNENLLQLSPLSLALVVLVPLALLRGRAQRATRVLAAAVLLLAMFGALLAVVPGGQENRAIVALFLPVHLVLAWALALPQVAPPAPKKR